MKLLEPLTAMQQDTNTTVKCLQRQIVNVQNRQEELMAQLYQSQTQQWLILGVFLLLHTIVQWFLR